MEAGLFLLLCLLALFMGTRARRSNLNQSPKAIRQKDKIKKFMLYAVLVLVTALLIVYIPFLFQEIEIAIDTHFEMDNYLSIGIVIAAIVVVATTISHLRKPSIS